MTDRPKGKRGPSFSDKEGPACPNCKQPMRPNGTGFWRCSCGKFLRDNVKQRRTTRSWR